MSAEQNAPGGFVLVARKTLESDLMCMNPLAFKLFFWMILKANFKDRDKLKRGQLVTTIEEMRNAGSYKAGYRNIRPSKMQIRTAYEALKNNTMIITAKTTRGMVVTVLNYDKYQNFHRYEQHSEQHSENATKHPMSAHDTESNKTRRNKTFSSDSDEFRLAELLFDLIRQRSAEFKAPDLQAWAKHIDLMIRIDGRTPERIEGVIRWAQRDSFWSKNILSTAKLREKFDALVMKMGGTTKPRINRGDLAAV
jgi:hypothetical protein